MDSKPGQNALDYPEVLTVSADLGLTRFLSEGLLPEGFWPSAVRSGLQALEVFRLRTFDAVIIDAAISDLPMDVLIERLRMTHGDDGKEIRQTVGTAIVVVAGIPQELEPYDIERISPDAVLVAPFELDALIDVLRKSPGENQ